MYSKEESTAKTTTPSVHIITALNNRNSLINESNVKEMENILLHHVNENNFLTPKINKLLKNK